MSEEVKETILLRTPKRKRPWFNWSVDKVSELLALSTPFIILLAIFIIAPYMPSQDLAKFAIFGSYGSILILTVGLTVFYAIKKRTVSMGKGIFHGVERFLQPNSREIAFSRISSRVFTKATRFNAEHVIEKVLKDVSLFGVDVPTNVQTEAKTAFEKLVKDLKAKLPKAERVVKDKDGKERKELVDYELWYYDCADTPILGVEENAEQEGKWQEGHELSFGTLMLVHPDHVELTKLFDFSSSVETFFAHSKSNTPAYLGSIDYWQFFEPLQVWLATPGLGRSYRFGSPFVQVTEETRQYAELTGLLRETLVKRSAKLREKTVLEAFDELMDVRYFASSYKESLEASKGHRENKSLAWARENWCIIFVVALVLILLIFGIFNGLIPLLPVGMVRSKVGESIRTFEKAMRAALKEFDENLRTWLESPKGLKDHLHDLENEVGLLTLGWTRPKGYSDIPRQMFHESILRLRNAFYLLDRPEREPSLLAQMVKAIGKDTGDNHIKQVAEKLEKPTQEEQMERLVVDQRFKERWEAIKVILFNHIHTLVAIGIEDRVQVNAEQFVKVEFAQAQSVAQGLLGVLAGEEIAGSQQGSPVPSSDEDQG